MGSRGKSGGAAQSKPRRARRKKRPLGAPAAFKRPPARVLARALGGAVALLAAMALGALVVVYPAARGPGDGHGVQVTLAPGLGPQEIATRLAEAGVLARPRL